MGEKIYRSEADIFKHLCDPLRPFGVQQMIYQGKGCIQRIPEAIKNEGYKRIMLVIDPGVKKALGKIFEDILTECGVEYCIYSDISPNPHIQEIEKIALPMAKEFKPDALLAVGGGSGIDSAKAISLLMHSNKSLKDLSNFLMSINPHSTLPFKWYPLLAVPTTAGTGTEVIRNAVITDYDGYKRVLMHDAILPKYAFCDPDMLATLPPHVAASSGMDALVQAIEAYVSLAASDFSETMSLRAVELIGPHIVPYYHNRSLLEHADAMSKGCIYQGIAWNTSFIAQIHGSNHPITEVLNVSHGESCAILLPPFVEWNGVVCKEKFRKVYNLMNPDHPVPREEFEPKMLVDKCIELNRQLNILNGKTLADLGCTEATIDEIINRQFAQIEKLPTYPRTTTKEDMKKLLIRVMNGEYT